MAYMLGPKWVKIFANETNKKLGPKTWRFKKETKKKRTGDGGFSWPKVTDMGEGGAN